MSVRKMLAMLITLAMALGWMATTAFAEEAETIALGDTRTFSVAATSDRVDGYVSYAFTPSRSGTYAFWVDDDKVEEHFVNLMARVNGKNASLLFSENYVTFYADAGETYDLFVYYHGVYSSDVEYTVWVEQWAWTDVFVGENHVTVPTENLFFSFIPEKTGYYRISPGDPKLVRMYGVEISMSGTQAEWYRDGDDVYYYLEGDWWYTGMVSSFDDKPVDTVFSIEYFESIPVIVPVSLAITSLPDRTVYPGDGFDGDAVSPLDLSGLELDIILSDGSVNHWSYDNYVNEKYAIGMAFSYEGDTVTVKVYLNNMGVEPVYFEMIRQNAVGEPPKDTESPEDSESVKAPELPGDPESVKDPELPGDPESVKDPELPGDPESVKDPELPEKSESVKDSEIPEDSETVKDPEPAVGSETIKNTESHNDTRPTTAPESPEATEPSQTQMSVDEANPETGDWILLVPVVILMISASVYVILSKKKKC